MKNELKRLNLKRLTALLIVSMLLFTSCTPSSPPENEKAVKKEKLYIHNKTPQRKIKWSFSIHGKHTYPLPKNKEMLLNIDLMGEFAQLKKKTSISVTPVDSNCIVTKINDQKFKVLVSDNFSSNILRLTIEASPNKNVTVRDTQYHITYNFQDKFYLSQLNNEVADK